LNTEESVATMIGKKREHITLDLLELLSPLRVGLNG
jgi:hypothetical protein